MIDNKPHIQKSQIRQFQKKILSWYAKSQRDLPWRRDRDPYHILVSEVMLQQTQVQRVIPKYQEWMETLPTMHALAQASTRDVLFHWSGLGYNRRALYLQEFARVVLKQFAGKIPQDEKVLRQLPGIGEYTARALLCFAFDTQVAVVDTNIKKVIAVHFFQGKVPDKKAIDETATMLLPKKRAYDWNQALMDYASQELKAYKIPISKQSKFKASDRYFRGLILRILLKNASLNVDQLLQKVCQETYIEKERYSTILLLLEKDGLIQRSRESFYSLPSETRFHGS